jgi:hypothetical protein
MQNFRI